MNIGCVSCELGTFFPTATRNIFWCLDANPVKHQTAHCHKEWLLCGVWMGGARKEGFVSVVVLH